MSGFSESLQPLSDASNRHTRFSLWNPVHTALANHLGSGPPMLGPADPIVAKLAAIVVAVVGLMLIYRHRKDATSYVVVVVALVAYQVLGAYVLAWYVAWSFPALALSWRSRTAAVAMGHASWVAIAYLNGYLAIVLVAGLMVWLLWRRYRGQPAFPWVNSDDRSILSSS